MGYDESEIGQYFWAIQKMVNPTLEKTVFLCCVSVVMFYIIFAFFALSPFDGELIVPGALEGSEAG